MKGKQSRIGSIGYGLAAMMLMVSFVVTAQKKKDDDTPIEPPKEITDNDKLEAEYYFIEAEKYYMLDNFAKAYEYYMMAYEKEPQNAAINYKIADVLTKNNEFVKALGYATAAVELNPTNKYYYLLLADLYSGMSNLPDAARTYESLLENVPNTDEHLFDLAAIYLYEKQLDKALATYDRAKKAFGPMEQITIQKQQIYLSQNNLEEAIREGEELIAEFPGISEYVISLAEILISNDQLEPAKARLEEVLENDPSNSQAGIRLSEIYRKEGNTEMAMELLQNAFGDKSLNFEAKVQMLAGYIAQLPNETLEQPAISLSQLLIEAHPDEANAYAIAGDLYYQLGQNEEALEMYNEVLERDQSNFGLWQNVLNLEMSMNLYKEVAAHAEEALELFPNQSALYYYGGTAYLIEKDYKKAIRLFEQGTKFVSGNPDLHSVFYGQLGDAYNGIEDHQNSDQAYEKALEIKPDNDHVLNNYSYFLSLRKENLEVALNMSSKLVEKYPDNSTYLDTHAWVLYVKGDFKEARTYLERAIEDENASSTIVEHYGDVLYQLGEVENAVRQWEIARDMDDASENLDKKIADRKLYE
ncbi:MAG: tetratricopeptide repeat protein [Bacteroidota bacterium]